MYLFRNDVVNDAVLFNVSSMKNQSPDSNYIQTNVLSELSMNDQNQKQSSKLNAGDSLIGNNSLDTKLMKNYNNRSTLEDNSTPGTGDTENKRKRFANDRGYFIAKELLSTERTYKKDLDVINLVSMIFTGFYCLYTKFFHRLQILIKRNLHISLSVV